ncbi:potassium-transporting ATPase subunit C [Cereibacter azotoformans]|uniref:potassium-transporting ATPase subunit C n=1 Tax=Cereibacter azotoformans TaxID=43057 RepID=UPI001EEBA035|nr:potassium-transporting ATPase subunit C [Cereibacter azotoformans]ULB11295.1 potassium-transporting ATPase subunit C [Cereibacter azotoformans]
MKDIISGLRVTAATMAICVAGYTTVILGFAQAVTPATANGSLITQGDGSVIGSRLIAQGFTSPEYVWPRPSAVDYDAAGAGGSNLSPANPELAERALALIAAHGRDGAPIPADLVTASGAGLDPHVSLEGALFQVDRVAEARRVEPAAVRAIIDRMAHRPGGVFTPAPIVNVLELNLELDAELVSPASTE